MRTGVVGFVVGKILKDPVSGYFTRTCLQLISMDDGIASMLCLSLSLSVVFSVRKSTVQRYTGSLVVPILLGKLVPAS